MKRNSLIAHLKAGLRSAGRRVAVGLDRILMDHPADRLFVGAHTTVNNLQREGIVGGKVRRVRDVMYDAKVFYCDRTRRPANVTLPRGEHSVLCTIHLAENPDDPVRLDVIVSMLNQFKTMHCARTLGLFKDERGAG